MNVEVIDNLLPLNCFSCPSCMVNFKEKGL